MNLLDKPDLFRFRSLLALASCHLLSCQASTLYFYYLLIGLFTYWFIAECFISSTVLAVAGEDFAIVASDTRLSEGYSIHSRDSPKCYKL